MQTLQGQVLIATPGLVDPNFFRTVVLIVEHTDEGAMGLVLNRPMELTIDAVWKEVGEGDPGVGGSVMQGGPCEGPIMVLHPHASASQIDVCQGVCFCTESDRVRWVIEESDGPARVFIGYSGWSPGQLENELDAGGWLTLPADTAMVFGDAPGEELWKQVMHRASRQRINVKHFPDDPSVN